MIEKRVKGIVLKTLHNTGEISVGFLKVLLVYEGIVLNDIRELVKLLQSLADKGYVQFKEPISSLTGSVRVDITPKGRAVVEGHLPDKEIDMGA